MIGESVSLRFKVSAQGIDRRASRRRPLDYCQWSALAVRKVFLSLEVAIREERRRQAAVRSPAKLSGQALVTPLAEWAVRKFPFTAPTNLSRKFAQRSIN
jgi:hypothetical protein